MAKDGDDGVERLFLCPIFGEIGEHGVNRYVVFFG